MLKLYFAPRTISIAVVIALEEAGLPYEANRVDFKTAQQTEKAYLAINPKGRVPALMTPEGTILTETGALLEYIAASAPNANLVPQDFVEAARMREAMYYLASTMHVAHAHKLRGSRWASQQSSFEDMQAKVPETMTECARFAEAEILRGDYVLGDTFSLADPYLFMVSSWLAGDGVNVGAFPKIQAYLDRMNARASVQSIRERGML